MLDSWNQRLDRLLPLYPPCSAKWTTAFKLENVDDVMSCCFCSWKISHGAVLQTQIIWPLSRTASDSISKSCLCSTSCRMRRCVRGYGTSAA